jgi:hypothetical protein
MKFQVFSVYDKAINAFVQPFYARTKGEAIRSFTEAANDEKHQFNRHSNDYSLMHLGEFDDNSGAFSTADPSRVISAVEVLHDDPFTPDTNVTKMPPRLPM